MQEGLKEVDDLIKQDRPPALYTSAGIASDSGAFSVDISLRAFTTSSVVGGESSSRFTGLWKALNGCVVDCRGAVEDTVKVFGLSLQDLFLLSKQGCSIRSKDEGRPGGLRSVSRQR